MRARLRPSTLPERPVPSDPGAPALAAGRAGFAIGNGLGELSLPRETRGAVLDWGGVYGQGVRLTGPWRVEDRPGPSGVPEVYRDPRVTQSCGSFRSVRDGPTLRVVEEVAAHPGEPQLLWKREISAPRSRDPVPINVAVEFEPMLSPVLMEGIRPAEFRWEVDGTVFRLTSGAFELTYDALPAPVAISRDGVLWGGTRYEGPVRSVRIEHHLTVPVGASVALRVVVAGGRRRRHAARPAPSVPDDWGVIHRAEQQAWIDATPRLEIPEAPELVEGYELARAAVRTLYSCPEPGYEGLVAGFPWYASLWCRDLARMLPALLWLGDRSWVAKSLDTVFSFQAPSRLAVLGATPGELPMQLSPGPVFLFGTSDTSLYYPGLVRRYTDHTGDLLGARRWYEKLERVRHWAEAKVDPSSGLFRNGGELEGMEETAQSERVRLGVDAYDTTIWDSADRRDHAVDLQLLWYDLLRDLASLSDSGGAPESWGRLGVRAAELAVTLPSRYRWPEEGYLFDSLRTDGTPVRQIRPNALQWVGTGLLPPSEERRLVERALSEDLTTPWGVRTLSASDPSYDPSAYHMGQVWPIATAWMVRAALRSGATEAGIAGLKALAKRFREEGGWANECLRGDRPEPFNSCFLLGFSVAPFLATIFEELFGLTPFARQGVLSVRPVEPRPFARMSLHGLSFGAGTLDLEFDEEGLAARWEGPTKIVLAGPSDSLSLDPGGSGRLVLPSGRQP